MAKQRLTQIEQEALRVRSDVATDASDCRQRARVRHQRKDPQHSACDPRQVRGDGVEGSKLDRLSDRAANAERTRQNRAVAAGPGQPGEAEQRRANRARQPTGDRQRHLEGRLKDQMRRTRHASMPRPANRLPAAGPQQEPMPGGHRPRSCTAPEPDFRDSGGYQPTRAFAESRNTAATALSWEDAEGRIPGCSHHQKRGYSTVTDLARFRGWSTSVPITTAV